MDTNFAARGNDMSRKTLNWYRVGADLGLGDHTCMRCEKDLRAENRAVVMLEFDQRVLMFHDFSGVPEKQSQGFFPFGLDCAKKDRKEAEKALLQNSLI